ncbi:hypothetical protein HY090_03195 [Candidatus Kaiserbacteria bacterium]|nr:hypothetical protein [Candidatus Kaiserbacteria bacterium]
MFLEWLAFYVVPATSAFLVARRLPVLTRRITVLHIGVLVSVAAMTLAGVRLESGMSILSIVCVVLSAACAVSFLGTFGIFYTFSAVVQEACLLLAGVLSISAFGLVPGILATTTVFALMHLVNLSNWKWKLLFTFLWGIMTLLVYLWLHQVFVNVGLHIILGAVFMHTRIFFPNRPTTWQI